MGRHSRKGRAAKNGAAEVPAASGPGPEYGSAGPVGPVGPMDTASLPGTAHGAPPPHDGTPARGLPHLPDGFPARGLPRRGEGTPPHGLPRFHEGTPGGGVPRVPDGTPAQGTPRLTEGTPGRGVPRFPDGTPRRGVPRPPDGTPAYGTPAYGIPRVRGGHPEQRGSGGGRGPFEGGGQGGAAGTAAGAGAGAGSATGTGPRIPRQREQSAAGSASYPGAGTTRPAHSDPPPAPYGPRQAYLDAFDEVDDVFAPGQRHRVAPRTAMGAGGTGVGASGVGAPVAGGTAVGGAGDMSAEVLGSEKAKGGRGRTFTGIAAAAVTTALAVVVAGQVAGGNGGGGSVQSQAAGGGDRDSRDDSASRGDERPTPSGAAGATTLTYDQKMGKRYELAADLAGDGTFKAVAGFDKAPGTGQKYRYRVDVEEGLGLDAELFAEAVQKTLNDDRSWAHSGGRTFERISSGQPDFVITLASPGTTADWCAKSGLDTTIDNVSCDSAATERVMINAYRWAQGAETYGDRLHAYRQMLINHEVGHRLGYNHVTCDKDGDLAPVMQQQTKFLDYNGIHCRANPWPFPGN